MKGFEPDSCFYFEHAEDVRGKENIELPLDPPPELVIEVDITRSSLNRFRIFAAVGVAEVWRYDGKRVRFHTLDAGKYHDIEQSLVIPPLTASQATVFIDRDRHQNTLDWLASVREWIRTAASH